VQLGVALAQQQCVGHHKRDACIALAPQSRHDGHDAPFTTQVRKIPRARRKVFGAQCTASFARTAARQARQARPGQAH
jgi:hypothetical protein